MSVWHLDVGLAAFHLEAKPAAEHFLVF